MNKVTLSGDSVFKYLIIAPTDPEFGLTVNTIGYEIIEPYSRYPLEGHPRAYDFTYNSGRRLAEYQIVYFLDGEGLFQSETTGKIKIEKGNLLILFPGQWHTYRPHKEEGWKVFYIGFQGEIMERLCSGHFFSKENQVLQIGFSEVLVGLFKHAIEIVKEDGILVQQRLAGIILNILTESLFLSKRVVSQKEVSPEIIERAKAMMYAQYDRQIDLESIAAKLCMGYSKFRKLFKKYTGYSPAQYFQEIKIRKAKEMLLDSELSAKQIAAELSFTSYDYFLSRFKKKTGITPQEFIKNHSLIRTPDASLSH